MLMDSNKIMERAIHSLELPRTNQIYVNRDTKVVLNFTHVLLNNISKYLWGFKSLPINSIQIDMIIWRTTNLINPRLGTTSQVKKFRITPRSGWVHYKMRLCLRPLGPTFDFRILWHILSVVLRRHGDKENHKNRIQKTSKGRKITNEKMYSTNKIKSHKEEARKNPTKRSNVNRQTTYSNKS